MGVIDDGIAFAQQRFRTVAGGKVVSRVEYWWLQDGVYQASRCPLDGNSTTRGSMLS